MVRFACCVVLMSPIAPSLIPRGLRVFSLPPVLAMTIWVEGPVDSVGNWDSCWRVFACTKALLLRGLARSLPETLTEDSVVEIFSFPIVVRTYSFRVVRLKVPDEQG